MEKLPEKIHPSVLSTIDRSSFIEFINGLMRGAVRLDFSLEQMEAVLTDPLLFENMTTSERLVIYKAVAQKQASSTNSVIKVMDAAVRNDFNQNFFGIANTAGDANDASAVEDATPQLTKEASIVLSEIAKRIALLEVTKDD